MGTKRRPVTVRTAEEMWAALTDDNVSTIRVAEDAALDGVRAMTGRTTRVRFEADKGAKLSRPLPA